MSGCSTTQAALVIALMLNKSNTVIAAAWAIPVISAALLHQIGLGNLQTASLLLVVGSLAITGINWHEHHSGRSPTFIFLILGCVFLCGRAFPVLFGGDTQLARISFFDVYDISTDTVMSYVLLVLASFFFVHLGSLLPRPTKVTLNTSRHDARIYLLIFAVLLPVYLYKNYYYFSYIMASGGYVAIYMGTEHIEGIGILVRLGALLCLAAFTLYFFHETNRQKSRLALIFFVVVFSSELLVGLRGKFFVVTLVLFLFYKIRFGGGFSIRGLLGLSVVIFILAIAVEIMRQGGSSIEGSLLMGFLAQQGATAAVNLVVIDNLQNFSPNAGSYFLRQFAVPFYSQPDVEPGWFLANDISMMVMPTAYALGFGTGSSYLAELLLLGGWVGVCAGSLAIGWLLAGLRHFYQGVAGAIMFWVVCGIVYYPRTMLQDPIHNLMRYAGPILFVAGCCWLLRRTQQQKRR